MEDVWAWFAGFWAAMSVWAERPLTNGYALGLVIIVAFQINAAANKIVSAIWSMNDDLAQRMPKRGHYQHDEWP